MTRSFPAPEVKLPDCQLNWDFIRAMLGGLGVHVPIVSSGPLPVSGDFTPGGGRCVIVYHGTGYVTAAGLTGVRLILDGTQVQVNDFYFNNAGEHHALPLGVYDAGVLPAQPHTIQLTTGIMVSDANDRFRAVVFEVPA